MWFLQSGQLSFADPSLFGTIELNNTSCGKIDVESLVKGTYILNLLVGNITTTNRFTVD